MGKNSDIYIYIYTVYGIPMLKLGIKPFKSEGECSQLFQKKQGVHHSRMGNYGDFFFGNKSWKSVLGKFGEF